MADAPQTTDQGDDAIVAALSGIIIDLVLDGRLGPGHGSRTAAEALIAELDQRGLRIVGARTGTLAANRNTNVSLAQYQQILGERNVLQAQLDAQASTGECICPTCGVRHGATRPETSEPRRRDDAGTAT